jgi:5-hydroxyisourate hydrolase-like protein (transthyretin family)
VPSHQTIVSRAVAIAILLFTVTTLAESQTATAAQAKDTPPPRTGSISGHVLINNKGAAGVEVGAFGGESFNRRIATAQTKTDGEGYYRLSGLPAANYQVTTFTADMIEAESTTPYPLGYGYFVSSKTILLGAGEDVNGIDLKLVRGGVITGRVTDSDDKPIVEERVNLHQLTEPGQPPKRLPPQSFLYQTDDRGIYRIYGLPPGRYRVSVGQSVASGVVSSASAFYTLTFHPDATDINRATVIDLAAGAEATKVDIKVSRRGETETHALTGRVLDAENNLPISGARVGVQVLREQGQGYSTGTLVTTSADGSFTIPAVTKGRYGVYVASENANADFYSEPITVDVFDQDVSGIEIKALRGTSISGTIVPENMELRELLRQVPGLRVSANVLPGDGRMAPTTIRSFGTAQVAADGSFMITGLRPGRVSFSLDSRDPAKRPTLVKVAAGGIGVTQGFEIERQPVSGVQLFIAYGTGAISGSVTIQGGNADSFRTMIICRREGSRTAASSGGLDARGHFTIRGLAPGSYDCGVQMSLMAPPPPGQPVARPPQIPHQVLNVSNDVQTEVSFLVDLTPKGVGP